jgi:hypothetical protein
MKDTRPINMLILTVFMLALLGFVAAAATLNRPQPAVEIHPAVVNAPSVDTAQDEQWAIHPTTMQVFQTLTTLSSQMCHALPQTSPVQIAGGRLPGMHTIMVQPWALICVFAS